MEWQSWRRGQYEISTDPQRLDLDLTHRFLSEEAYWSAGVPVDVVRSAIDGSIVFGVYRGQEQVGFARVVTDKATFAWLCDVFVLASERGHGLGKWLMECVKAHPDLQSLRRWMLATPDAHGLYAQFGFVPVDPDRFMEIRDPDIYKRSAQ